MILTNSECEGCLLQKIDAGLEFDEALVRHNEDYGEEKGLSLRYLNRDDLILGLF